MMMVMMMVMVMMVMTLLMMMVMMTPTKVGILMTASLATETTTAATTMIVTQGCSARLMRDTASGSEQLNRDFLGSHDIVLLRCAQHKYAVLGSCEPVFLGPCNSSE